MYGILPLWSLFYCDYTEISGIFTDYGENGVIFTRILHAYGAEIRKAPIKCVSDTGSGGVHDVSKDGVDRPCIFIAIEITDGMGDPLLKLKLDIWTGVVVRI